MDGYYGKYLKDSEVYKNLESTKQKTQNQIDKIKDLQTKLSGSSGNNIDTIKTDLDNVTESLNTFIGIIDGTKTNLESKASTFDTALNAWKTKIGQDYFPATEHIIDQLTDVSTGTYVTTKTTEKITDVYVGTTGHICVKTNEKRVETTTTGEDKSSKVVYQADHVYEEDF